jgi:hypothetical protein
MKSSRSEYGETRSSASPVLSMTVYGNPASFTAPAI